MEQIIKIDDSVLLSKRVIKKSDIEALLPEDIKSQVRDIRVMVDHGQPMWMIFLVGGGAYLYEPLNKDKEMIFDVSGIRPAYGKIYLCRKARVLRYEEKQEPSGNKYYTVFLCFQHAMFFWREVREFWFTLDKSGPGCIWFPKWFRHYNV